jgi:hypothetical protein
MSRAFLWLSSIRAVTLLFLVTATTLAQATTDLIGTWVLDEARSDPAAVTAARGRGGRGGVPANQLQITQAGNDLTVARGNQTFIYHLDGTEMTGPPGGETKSTVAWEGGKFVVTWKREFFAGAQAGYVTATGKDTYTISGGVLTVERQSNDPRRGAETVQAVYTKAP